MNENSTEKLNATANGRRLASAMARQANDVVYRIRENKIDERLNSKLKFSKKKSLLPILYSAQKRKKECMPKVSSLTLTR